MFDATPLLKLYTRRRAARLALQKIEQEQEQQLLKLVRRAADTDFGRDHDFAGIKSVSDYQDRVPLRNYDAMWRDYWKERFPVLKNCSWPGQIPFFAVSSGTSSGTTKYIPYTHEMTASNQQGAMDMLTHHMTNRPQSRIFGGRCFLLGGSTALVKRAPGIYSGDLSGIAVKTMAWWAKQRYFPPSSLTALSSWEEKISVLSETSLTADIRMLSGVPSWTLIFLDHMAKLLPNSDGKLKNIYPNLELLVHGGVNFTPYYKRFQALLEGSHAEMREVYPASEGFVAVADGAFGEGLRLITDHGIFFEFVPLEELDRPNPTRHWVDNIECGVNYAIVLTTCAGLFSYVLGDTVRFVNRRPARLLVTGRTSYYLSAFGEHVIAEEVEDAISAAANAISCSVSDYSVGPLYPERSGDLGGHLYVVEFAERVPEKPEMTVFLEALDKRLGERNEDYRDHRAKGFGLKPPRALVVKPGTFAAWMKSRGKAGGQNKVPRIIMAQDLFKNLRDFALQQQ